MKYPILVPKLIKVYDEKSGARFMCTGGQKYNVKALSCNKSHPKLFKWMRNIHLKDDKTFENMRSVKTM